MHPPPRPRTGLRILAVPPATISLAHDQLAAGKALKVPGLRAEEAIAIVPGSRPTPACLEEATRDEHPTMPYALFLTHQTLGPDGRLGGPVVFARDFGARDSLLRSRFLDRTRYRYRPHTSPGDTTPLFVRMNGSP